MRSLMSAIFAVSLMVSALVIVANGDSSMSRHDSDDESSVFTTFQPAWRKRQQRWSSSFGKRVPLGSGRQMWSSSFGKRGRQMWSSSFGKRGRQMWSSSFGKRGRQMWSSSFGKRGRQMWSSSFGKRRSTMKDIDD